MFYTLMRNLHEEDWERTVDVNCRGMLNCVGAVLPGDARPETGAHRHHLLRRRSEGVPGLAVYSASKFFVEALSQGLRLETAGTGSR
jgi:NADP-dependent 3-hydroxy acid dehydrogenase YdfG